MPFESDPEMGVNSWFEDELHRQYLLDRTSVDESLSLIHISEPTRPY